MPPNPHFIRIGRNGAGRGHFEGAFGALLPLDVGEIDEPAVVVVADSRARPVEHLRAAKMIGKLDQRAGGDDLHLGTGPGGFGPASGRADQTFAAAVGPNGSRQHAGDGSERAVEPEFSQYSEPVQRVMRNSADRGHQAERDRQVVVAALFRQVGGGEVDGDAASRERQP